MSSLKLLNQSKISIGEGPLDFQPSDFSDVVSSTFESIRDNFNIDSQSRLIEDERIKRRDEFKDLTGINLRDEARKRAASSRDVRIHPKSGIIPEWEIDKFEEQVVNEWRKSDERFQGIKTLEDLQDQAAERARLSAKEAEKVRKGATGFAGTVGSLVGGLGAIATDPLNIASLPLGAGAGRTLLKTILIEAGINAGTELATQPFVAEWQNKIGNEYGITDAVENVGMAALFGGAFGGGAKVLSDIEVPNKAVFFQKIAESEALPPSVRRWAKNEAANAHLVEDNPLRGIDDDAHFESATNVYKKVESGERITSDDIKITEDQFQSSRFADQEELLPIDQVNDLKMNEVPQELVESIGRSKAKRFDISDLPENDRSILRAAGVDVGKDGKINARRFKQELRARQKGESIYSPRAIAEGPKSQFLSTPGVENPDLKKALDEFDILDKDPEPVATQRALLERSESPEIFAVERKELADFLEKNKDFEFTLDDGTKFKGDDLMREFEQADIDLSAITSCSV